MGEQPRDDSTPRTVAHLTSGNKKLPVTHGEKRLLPRKCVQQNNQRSFELKFHDSKSHLHNKGFVLGRAVLSKDLEVSSFRRTAVHLDERANI